MDNFELHEGEQYKVINAKDYVISHKHEFFTAIKKSNVVAIQGFVGQEVDTVMKNGLTETKNIVSYNKFHNCV